jgi:hypothetical protein
MEYAFRNTTPTITSTIMTIGPVGTEPSTPPIWLIFYVVVPADDDDRRLRQIVQSWRSLRMYDSECDVHLLHCGPPSPGLLAEVERNRVIIHELPPYADLLAGLSPHWQSFLDYPVLAKILCFDRLPLNNVGHVLYCDCDTYFFASPRHLFDRYRDRDFYACAEVRSRAFARAAVSERCRRAPYDPSFVDEDALAAIAESAGLAFVAPINTGVMLMRRGVCGQLTARRGQFLEYVARLRSGDLPLSAITSSSWIAEEVATWLLLGSLPGITIGHFSGADVPLSDYGYLYEPSGSRVLAHYLSTNSSAFFDRYWRW